MITEAFPVPDRLLRHAFGQLRVAQFGTHKEKAEHLGDTRPVDLPRPWDPPSCPPTLRSKLWLWLDEVAGWINHDYTWQVDRMIPGCWPAHPHLAHDLAVLACLRYDAGFALSPDTLEEWHRYSLPGFMDRIAARTGGTGCPPGKHTDWPAASRHKDYGSPAAVHRRLESYRADSRPGRTDATNGSRDRMGPTLVIPPNLDRGRSPQ